MIANLGLGIVLSLVASLEYELVAKMGLGQVASPGLGVEANLGMVTGHSFTCSSHSVVVMIRYKTIALFKALLPGNQTDSDCQLQLQPQPVPDCLPPPAPLPLW